MVKHGIPEAEYRKYLETLDIFELRNVGREKHVKSPTTYRAEDLRQAILDVEYGRVAPHYSRYGRPPKSHRQVPLPERSEKEPTDPSFGDDRAKDGEWQEITALAADGAVKGEISEAEGFLTQENGAYRLRCFLFGGADVVVPPNKVREIGLKEGDLVRCNALSYAEQRVLKEVLSVNGGSPQSLKTRADFDGMEALYPETRYLLSEGDDSLRCIDLFAPVGKGQRALVVAPPKTGKTEFLKKIAAAMGRISPLPRLFILLVGERPEEVSEFKSLGCGRVFAAPFGTSSARQIESAESVILHGKRLAEGGEDVVILLDSLTALLACDGASQDRLKSLFSDARNIAAGSLTVIATLSPAPGAEAFIAACNADIRLSKGLAKGKIYPALDVLASGTVKAERLQSEEEATFADQMRSTIEEGVAPAEALCFLANASQDGSLTEQYAEWKKNG